MMQIKKKFFIFFVAFIFSLPIHHYDSIMVKAAGIENFTDVADQKSVIEEQNEKEVILNQYTVIINSLSQEEKDLIWRITYLEAGNQCIEGQRAVIEVILNRMIGIRWPNTVESVLSAPGQFSTWKHRNKVSTEQINQMNNALYLVANSKNTILPNSSYVYFNCSKNRKNGIKIQSQWFWS